MTTAMMILMTNDDNDNDDGTQHTPAHTHRSPAMFCFQV